MLLSKLILNTRKGKFNSQPIQVQNALYKCDNCGKEYERRYILAKEYNIRYGQDLCHCCALHHPLNKNFREIQRLKIKQVINNNTGKTYEEICGKEKAKKRKDEMRKPLRERKGFTEEKINAWIKAGQKASIKKCKYKTLEEIHGNDKAKEIKQKISYHSQGFNNPMYGKPSPQGSGNGWSGWYKGWFFRSLLELSYMINVIEKNGWKWKSVESKDYKIPYIIDGKERNYFCDFLIKDKQLTEIKPKNLRRSKQVLAKEDAAIKWCNEHNLVYKIICDNEFDKLSFDEIKTLHNNGIIKFINRYEEKYKKWQ